MPSPTVTVVVPVFNRERELERALSSLAAQTFADFECLVVDDASTSPIRPTVDKFDDRFRYIRNVVNSGCTGARLVGYKQMRGDVVMQLDSDNEFLPHAIERALHFLEATPSLPGVSGLYQFPDGLRGRVPSGQKVLTPTAYARGEGIGCDMVGAVRREYATAWTQKRPEYFNTDFHIWLTHHSTHDHLMVDEPWGRFHVDAPTRISSSTDIRNVRDAGIFVSEHAPIFGTRPNKPLDRYLRSKWLKIRDTGEPEVDQVSAWMRERGLSDFGATIAGVRRKVSRKLRGERWVF